MFTIIALPGDAVAQITTNASGIFADLFPILALVLGVLLGVLIITFIVRSLHR